MEPACWTRRPHVPEDGISNGPDFHIVCLPEFVTLPNGGAAPRSLYHALPCRESAGRITVHLCCVRTYLHLTDSTLTECSRQPFQLPEREEHGGRFSAVSPLPLLLPAPSQATRRGPKGSNPPRPAGRGWHAFSPLPALLGLVVGAGGGGWEEAGLPHLPLWPHSSLNCFLFVSCGSGKMQLFFLANPFCIFPLPVLSLPSTALMLSLST